MPQYILTKKGPVELPADLEGAALEAAANALLAEHGAPPAKAAPTVTKPVAPAKAKE